MGMGVGGRGERGVVATNSVSDSESRGEGIVGARSVGGRRARAGSVSERLSVGGRRGGGSGKDERRGETGRGGEFPKLRSATARMRSESSCVRRRASVEAAMVLLGVDDFEEIQGRCTS